MMKPIFAIVLTLFLFSCEDNLKIAASTVGKPVGIWHYVGKFDHRADYRCYVCEGYDKNKAYKLVLNEDGTMKGNVGFLLLEGKYEVTTGDNQKIQFLNIQRTNKPLERPEETEFIQHLGTTENYAISKEEKFESALTINIGEENFLYFVK